MIDQETLFSEIQNNLALDCPAGMDTNDLIRIAGTMIERNIPVISVSPADVATMWTWLEKSMIKIIARFDAGGCASDISSLSEQINAVFKKGAHGARIFVNVCDLPDFVSALAPIREDLFFNKDLMIDLDMCEIGPDEWPQICEQLNKIRANAIILNYNKPAKRADDFVGRIYGLMTVIAPEIGDNLYFETGNDFNRIEQVWRLVEKMRPELTGMLRFFVGNKA